MVSLKFACNFKMITTSVTEQIYTIRIDFESLFYKLFENEGILAISKRGRNPPSFTHSRNFKVKKSV